MEITQIPQAQGASSGLRWIRWLESVGLEEVPLVGGKNASLGEMIRELSPLGIAVPGGFAITAQAYRHFVEENHLAEAIREIYAEPTSAVQALEARAHRLRTLILQAPMPEDLKGEITRCYREMAERYGGKEPYVAVRSSATAEDLPTASFAGAHQTFLQVHGELELLRSVQECFASLHTPRAIRYREDMGFPHEKVLLSVGVQLMVRSDLASSGVIFTLDTETGFREVVVIDAIWGLGENIVQGKVKPDEFKVHKPTLAQGFRPIVSKKLGTKEFKLVYNQATHRLENLPVPPQERARFTLSEEEILTLARWAIRIEEHYSQKRGQPTPMDIEFAKDGLSGQLFVVQARPETVQSQKLGPQLEIFTLKSRGKVLAEGIAVGQKIAVGQARVIHDPKEIQQFCDGEVLVAENTDPDWEPIMKRASAIVTERGGRTSHAAIVARELGLPAVVGAEGALGAIPIGQTLTVSCAEGEVGRVYEGRLEFSTEQRDPTALGPTRTKIMVNVGNPEQAFELARWPNDGVGLARMEFIFAGYVKVHPLALTRYPTLPLEVQRQVEALTEGYTDKTAYFVDKLAQGIATLAAAFYPKDVILRFSDFKTNEYAALVGGAGFEPKEENPMLGWRGASRYYHPDYKEGFLLEVAAVKRVREEMGLKNLKVMIPFCRTPEEGRKVLAVMQEGGLERGKDGLEVYVMAEIPSNVLEAEAFAELFDGFSIGSNDLTQLILGVDRDSAQVSGLFDERLPSVKRACTLLLEAAHAQNRTVGICGQAPSDYPEFAAFLVEHGIDSISLNPDSVWRVKERILEVERAQR